MNSRLELQYNKDKSIIKVGKKEYKTDLVVKMILEKGTVKDIEEMYSAEKRLGRVSEELSLYEDLLARGLKTVRSWHPNKAIILDDMIIQYPSVILVSKKLKNTIIKVPNKSLLNDYGILKDIL